MPRRLAAFLVAATLVAACTGGDDTPSVPERTASPAEALPETERFRFGVLGDVGTLDPYSRRATDLTFALVRPVYPSLHRFLPDGSIEPYLAASLADDRDRAIVTLAEMRWSDGRRIDAADVVASWRRAGKRSRAARAVKARVRSRFKVVFSGEARNWTQLLATNAPILPRGKAGDAFGGPYVISERDPGRVVSLRPNEEWSGPAPSVQQLDVFSIDTTGTMLSLLERGRLDAAWFPSTVNLGERLDATDLEHDSVLGWSSIHLAFGDDVAPETAEAVSGAIDRAALGEAFIRDLGRVTDTLQPRPGPGGAEGPFRAGAGTGAGSLDLVLAAPHGDELLGFLQDAIQLQLADAGFDVGLIGLPLADIYARGFEGASLLRSEGAPGTRDPASAYDRRTPLFHAASWLAWGPQAQGLEVNPTSEGPLWNAHEWFLTPP